LDERDDPNMQGILRKLGAQCSLASQNQQWIGLGAGPKPLTFLSERMENRILLWAMRLGF
jgi:hypothetical protein